MRAKGRLVNNTAASGLGPSHLARSKALLVGVGNKGLRPLGLPSLFWQVLATLLELS